MTSIITFVERNKELLHLRIQNVKVIYSQKQVHQLLFSSEEEAEEEYNKIPQSIIGRYKLELYQDIISIPNKGISCIKTGWY